MQPTCFCGLRIQRRLRAETDFEVQFTQMAVIRFIEAALVAMLRTVPHVNVGDVSSLSASEVALRVVSRLKGLLNMIAGSSRRTCGACREAWQCCVRCIWVGTGHRILSNTMEAR